MENGERYLLTKPRVLNFYFQLVQFVQSVERRKTMNTPLEPPTADDDLSGYINQSCSWGCQVHRIDAERILFAADVHVALEILRMSISVRLADH